MHYNVIYHTAADNRNTIFKVSDVDCSYILKLIMFSAESLSVFQDVTIWFLSFWMTILGSPLRKYYFMFVEGEYVQLLISSPDYTPFSQQPY